MASPFVETDEEEVRNTRENKNTNRSTDYWTNIFQKMSKDERKK